MKFPDNFKKWIPVLIAVVLAATGLVVTVDDRENTISITVQGPAGPTAITTTTEAKAEAAEGVHANTKDERPAGLSTAELAQLARKLSELAELDNLPTEIPDAAPKQAGCRTRLVQNKSSRNGVRPRLLVMHYTVSPNRPGFTDVDGITAYFNQRSSGVSSNYVIDRDGNCNLIVRESEKAWTQAAANPFAISWEIINTGSERRLFTTAGLRRYARTVSDAAARWGIPIRRGSVRSNCVPNRSGIIDHNDLGACGGGHHDVTPFDVDDLIAAVRAYRATSGADARQAAKWCRSLAYLRTRIRARTSTPAQRSRARALRGLTERRGIVCG